MGVGFSYWRSDTAFEPGTVAALRRLITRAGADVPFYRSFWHDAGVDVRRLRLPEDLAMLPVVRKADLLGTGLEQRLARTAHGERFVTERSSGSTGQPFEMWLSTTAMRQRRQRFIRALLASGYVPGSKLMLVATRRASALMKLLRWHYADLRDDETSLLHAYIAIQPRMLYAPLSSLVILAQQLERESTQPQVRPVLISKAEPLRAWHRRLLTSALSTSVTDFYGMTELGFVASRRQQDTCYFTPRSTFVLEFLPIAGNQSEERLIVTDLSNAAMPMIRYDTGDLVRRDFSAPGAPIIEFSGRTVDRLRMPDGSWISPLRVEAGLEEINGVDRFQVEQAANLALRVSIWTHRGEPAPILHRVEAFMRDITGDRVAIAISHRQDSPGIDVGEKLRPVRSLADIQQ